MLVSETITVNFQLRLDLVAEELPASRVPSRENWGVR